MESEAVVPQVETRKFKRKYAELSFSGHLHGPEKSSTTKHARSVKDSRLTTPPAKKQENISSMVDDFLAEQPCNLDKLQEQALTLVLEGKNVFLTGGAGTGKSYLVELMKELLAKKGRSGWVTATTGKAAENIGGVTFHSFMGLGGKNYTTVQELYDDIARNPAKLTRLQSVSYLIIDEISMLPALLFHLCDYVLRCIKQKDLPFGGMQIIGVGDFFQLPPVSNKANRTKENDESSSNHKRHYRRKVTVGTPYFPDNVDPCAFAFLAPSWEATFPPESSIVLTTIYRQNDPEFQNFLNAVRIGEMSEEATAFLEKLVHQSKERDEESSPHHRLKIYCLRLDVDSKNESSLAQLDAGGDGIKSFQASGAFPMPSQTSAKKNLQLKVGAPVMFIKNTEQAKNGSLGTVEGFVIDSSGVEPLTLPLVNITSTEETVAVYPERFAGGLSASGHREFFYQVPLTLAFATTIHKVQGMTLPEAEVDFKESVFECGQVYVALSRAKTREGLTVRNFDPKMIKVSPVVKEFYAKLGQK